MRISKLFVAAFVAASAMVSCTSKQVCLDGGWEVKTVGGVEVSTSEKAPVIAFNSEEGKTHGCLGVNLFHGAYTFEDGKLTFGNLGMTMMAGPEADMAVEYSLQAALEACRSAKVKDDMLYFYDESGKELVSLKKIECKECEGHQADCCKAAADSCCSEGAAACDKNCADCEKAGTPNCCKAAADSCCAEAAASCDKACADCEKAGTPDCIKK